MALRMKAGRLGHAAIQWTGSVSPFLFPRELDEDSLWGRSGQGYQLACTAICWNWVVPYLKGRGQPHQLLHTTH
jgi:hypothetical protein